MKIISTGLLILLITLLIPVHAQVVTLTPKQKAAAIRYAKNHGFMATNPVRRISGTPTNKQSEVSKLWNTIQSGVLGSLGVVAGSAVAWYTLRKKKKAFTTYYEQIKTAQQRYFENLKSDKVDRAKAKLNFKKELVLIQEEAELNAADKKLDQEQLTAIINKVDRMIKEI